MVMGKGQWDWLVFDLLMSHVSSFRRFYRNTKKK